VEGLLQGTAWRLLNCRGLNTLKSVSIAQLLQSDGALTSPLWLFFAVVYDQKRSTHSFIGRSNRFAAELHRIGFSSNALRALHQYSIVESLVYFSSAEIVPYAALC
jgi:hypothetical protein